MQKARKYNHGWEKFNYVEHFSGERKEDLDNSKNILLARSYLSYLWYQVDGARHVDNA